MSFGGNPQAMQDAMAQVAQMQTGQQATQAMSAVPPTMPTPGPMPVVPSALTERLNSPSIASAFAPR